MSTEQNNQDNDKFKINYKPVIIWTIVTIVLLFIWVYVLTCNIILPGFDLTNTGPIGDTIGGLTAPVIGISGAVLVYISFQGQLNANQLQIKALNEEKERFATERLELEAIGYLNQKKEILNTLQNEFKSIELYYPVNDKYIPLSV